MSRKLEKLELFRSIIVHSFTASTFCIIFLFPLPSLLHPLLPFVIRTVTSRSLELENITHNVKQTRTFDYSPSQNYLDRKLRYTTKTFIDHHHRFPPRILPFEHQQFPSHVFILLSYPKKTIVFCNPFVVVRVIGSSDIEP